MALFIEKTKAREGEQEIKHIIAGEPIAAEIRFVRPMNGIAHTEIKLLEKEHGCAIVEWEMRRSMRHPLNFLRLFFSMDKLPGMIYKRA